MADNGHAEIAEAMARVPLFRGLRQGQREDIARHTTRRTYPAGATIVKQGDTSMSFYIVLSGKVRFVREGESGGEADAADGGPGTFFGEMGLIDDTERERTVIADEPTECALLVKHDFQHELREEPDIALALLPVLTSRIRRLEKELDAARASAG
jgi:CRP-like cAMP-binding protein